MVFANWKIRTRILMGFGVLCAISLCMALYAAEKFSRTSERLDDIVHEHLVKISQTKALQDNLNFVALSLRNMVLQNDAAHLQAEKQRMDQASAQNGELLGKLNQADNEPSELAALEIARTARAAYVPLMKQAIELALAGDREAASALIFGELDTVHKGYLDKLQQFVNLEIQLATTQSQQAQADAQRASWILMAAAVASVLIGAAVAWAVAASVTRPISEAVELADAVAAGDLTRQIQPHSEDEAGHLLQALRSMNDSLASMVNQVRMASDSIVTGSTQVAAGSADLSQRTESQAANLQQTAASLEQLTATVAQTSTTARQATELAHQASRAATQGGDVVGKVVQTMNHISASSHQMSEIIGVIDGIAFQTNILALNAAVEAARAGEAGRGFAVVAGEVRNLAKRSAEAAQEIKALIQTSIANVETGSELVAEAGQAMGDIVHQVRRVTDLIDDMSHAAAEQTGGIQQINSAVAQMDEMTQQNAALVEESNAAAASLQSQATDLTQAVAVFRTTDRSARHPGQVQALALLG